MTKVPLVLLVAALAGCVSQAPADVAPDDHPEPPPIMRSHVLADTKEPVSMVAPTFKLLGSIAAGGPAYGAGEPSVWADLEGRIFIAFPGCDQGFALAELPTDEGTCAHGLVYQSDDDGETWTRLNRDGDGRYDDGDVGPAANNDADVAVDAAGTLWASNLGGGGIQLHALRNGSWDYVANIVPPTENPDDDPAVREGADRQWVAAAGPGHVINAWMRTSPVRDVAINTTFDGGKTWTGRANFGDNIGWLGSPQFAPDGMTAYIPYTQPASNVAGVLVGPNAFEMHVLRTFDGGVTWDDVATGWTWETTTTGNHWSGGHMAPTLDVTGDGTVILGFAVDDTIGPLADAPFVTQVGASVFLQASKNHGDSWSREWRLQTTSDLVPGNGLGHSVMAWITGGAGDRFAVTYLYNDSPADNDYAGLRWDVRAAVIDGLSSGRPNVTTSVIEEAVHVGGICTRGGQCLITGSDRAFLDFFESDLLPDGRLVVSYPHDFNPQKMIDIKVAIQDGGTPLLDVA